MKFCINFFVVCVLFLAEPAISMASPASVNCAEMGGNLRIVETPTGQVGMCVFPDGTVCEEWALYHGKCDPHTLSDVQQVNQLIQVIEGCDRENKTKAALSLGIIGDPSAVSSLVEALNDDDMGVRDVAAEALGMIGDVRAVDPLIYSLGNDEEWKVRCTAAEALGNIGDVRALDPLIQALQEPNWVSHCAEDALADIGYLALKPLIISLSDAECNIRAGAAGALGKIGNLSALEPLYQALNDENGYVRWKSAESLCELGDMTPLIRALKDTDPDVRRRAACHLGYVGDSSAIGPLTEALNDNDPEVKRWAEISLEKISEKNSPPKDLYFSCVNTGGTVTDGLCCNSVGDFPNTCLIGGCGCSPTNSHMVKICNCGEGKCFDGKKCVDRE